MIADLSIAGHLVEAGADTAPTEAATAVVVATVEAVSTVAVAMAVAVVVAAMMVAVDMVEAGTAVAVVGTTVAVAILEGPAVPISAATGSESVPDSMGRRRLSGRRA